MLGTKGSIERDGISEAVLGMDSPGLLKDIGTMWRSFREPPHQWLFCVLQIVLAPCAVLINNPDFY